MTASYATLTNNPSLKEYEDSVFEGRDRSPVDFSELKRQMLEDTAVRWNEDGTRDDWEVVFNRERSKLEGMAWGMAKKFFIPGMTNEDLVQEYMGRVSRICRYWDPERGALSTIAWRDWLNYSQKLMAKASTAKRGGLMAGRTENEVIVGDHIDLMRTKSNDSGIFDEILKSSKYAWIMDLPIHKLSKRVLVLILTDDECTKQNGTIHKGVVMKRLGITQYDLHEVLVNLNECAELREELDLL